MCLGGEALLHRSSKCELWLPCLFFVLLWSCARDTMRHVVAQWTKRLLVGAPRACSHDPTRSAALRTLVVPCSEYKAGVNRIQSQRGSAWREPPTYQHSEHRVEEEADHPHVEANVRSASLQRSIDRSATYLIEPKCLPSSLSMSSGSARSMTIHPTNVWCVAGIKTKLHAASRTWCSS